MQGVDSIRFGRATVWSFLTQSGQIADPKVRQRVSELLNMYQDQAGDPKRTTPVRNIGVASVGPLDLRPLKPSEAKEIENLRFVLFLCCLADNVRWQGPNSGHNAYTSDNFDVIRQTFNLGSESLADKVGVIVRRTLMGYRIDTAKFLTPAHVNRPNTFRYDSQLLAQLRRLRRSDRALCNRILRATGVFLASYYNSHSLSIDARVLLQASAFEILFDLPEKDQRLAFKNAVEDLLAYCDERRYRYKYEVRSQKKSETRTIKGIWADRFYTLRNHLIHGNIVPQREYVFRASQHHLVVSPIVFVLAAKKLIDRARRNSGQSEAFSEKLSWTTSQPVDDDQEPSGGFRIDNDFAAMIRNLPSGRRALRAFQARDS